MGKLTKVNQNTGPKTFGTGRLVKISEPVETPKTFGTREKYSPSNELVGLAYESLRSGTLPATTQFGRVNLPTGSASQRASMLNDFAQLSDDRKREALEAERRQLTQPWKVYDQETTEKNRARVQEIDQELSTLLPEKSGRLKSGVQSILSTAAASLPVIVDTILQLNKNTEVRGESDELNQLLEVNRKIRALEGARKGEALDYIRSQDQWKELNQQRIELNQKLQDMMSVPVSSDSTGMQMMRQANQYREQALNGLEGVPRFLGETALSIGQNAALLPTAAINPALPLVAMGTMAAADKTYELNERGLSPSEALTRGAISGGIEAATEKIPLDSLLSVMRTGGTTALRNILRQAGIEAGEESVSYVANYIADKAAKDPEAEFSLAELARSAAGGALSGGVFGTAGTGINIINDYASGQRPSFSEGMSTFQEQSQNSAAAQLAQEMAQERLDRISRPAQLSELWQAPSVEAAQTEASLQEAETVPSYREAQRIIPSAQNDMLQTERAETAGLETRQAPSSREIQSQIAAEERTPVQRQAAVTQESAAVDELISAFGENGQKAFRSVYQENSDLPASFQEFSRAYNQGLSGAAESAVEQGRHINTQAAYYAGQNDAAASLAREKRAAKFAPTAGEGSGLVYDDYVDGALDTETADKVNSVAKLLGVRVQFVDSVREGTANAQISGSDVLVEKNNPNPVMFLLGHEWTHRLQETAPVEYRKFRDLVSDEVSGEARVILDQYRDSGETITYEAALDEAAANYAGRMIEDGAVLDDFIQRHRTDRTLLEKIRDAIRTIISKLTGAERRQAQTAEGRLSAALEASAENVRETKSKVNSVENSKFSRKGTENARELAKVQEENDLLRERVDYWKSQTKRSKQATTDKKSVSKAARALVKEYSSTLEAADISNDLQSLYDFMASGQKNGAEYSYDDARKDAGEIASRLVESALEVNDELYRDYADLRQYLKDTKLTISAADAADILNYNDLRKQNFGRVTVSKGQTNIDQVYQELSERWPDFFDDQQQTHPGDQLERIFDVLGEIYRVTEENPYSRYMDEAVAGATNEILETFFDLPQTKKTFADVQAAKLDAAKAKGKQQLQQQREQSDARLDRLREQNRERVQNAIQRERSVRDRQLQRLRDQYTARDAAGRERRNAKELRNRITRHASQLSQKLLSPSDKQHIPDALRKTVASVLDAINLESPYVIDPETGKRVKNGVGDPVKRTEAFQKLKDQYKKIMKDESSGMVIDPELFGDPLSGVDGNFDKVLNMKDVRLSDMSSEQLQIVWNVLRAVERSVSTAGKVLSKAKYTETAGWANALARDTSTRRTKTSLLDKSLLQSLEDPYTFFSHYGEAGKAIYRMLRNAQDQQQRMTTQVTEEAQKIADPKTVKQLEKTTKTFRTERGESLTLTTAQIMEIYELMKRPQAQDHLTQGGIIQPEIKSAKIKRGNEAILLTAKDLADIAASLTDDEVRMADRLQRLTNGLLAGWGNEASNQVFGYSKFTEDNYWPIRAAQEETHSKSENSDKNVRSIKNISLAKSTVPGAKNALNVGSIFDTFSSHAGDMIDYAAWLAAMEDANRLYNFKFQTTDSSSTRKTIKGLLDQYGGPGAQQYWRNLMDNIQNGISAPQDDSLTGLFTKSIGSFKGAAVGGNLRVTIQQPTAFFRANAVLSPADLARGIAGGVTKGNGWKKALEWSPIAMRKDAGGFDISSPRKMKELLFDSRDRLRRVNDTLSAPAGMADAVTWGRLWNACEWATAREHSELKPGSAAFYQQVNERFTDMIDQTQVVDGVLQRSNIMRSRNSIAQQATSFMGEPIKSLNMFLRSWDQMRYEQDPVKRGKAMKTVGRTAFALIATNVVNALAQSVVDGLRDDDKEKDYLERLFSAFTGLTGDEESAWDKAVALTMEGNVGSNINPINQVPFVKDILSLAQGYDVSRTDMEVAADLVRAAQTVSQNIDGKGPKTVAYAVKELVAAGAKIFGVPVSNLTRDIWGIVRTAAYETGNIPLQYEMEKAIYNLSSDKNYSRFIDTLYMAKKSGDDEVYQSIYNDMVKNGVPEEKIRTGMESRMKRDQGVESVNDLDQRYLTPTQEKTYQASIEKVTGTSVWRSASQEQKDALEDDLYELTTGSQAGQKIQEKIDAGSKSGVSETDYLLYMLALDIADSQNEDPEKRNGSTDQSEAETAINMIPGLTDEARAYLWQSTNKGWKEDNNPWK